MLPPKIFNKVHLKGHSLNTFCADRLQMVNWQNGGYCSNTTLLSTYLKKPSKDRQLQTFLQLLLCKRFPTGTELLDEKVMTIDVQKGRKMYFDGASRSQA